MAGTGRGDAVGWVDGPVPPLLDQPYLSATMKTLRRLLPRACAAAFLSAAAMAPPLPAQDEEDNSVEGLYHKAVELNVSGQHAEASAMFDRMFETARGVETLFEDYGAQAGGILFDYGMTLLPQERWEDAKQAFADCVNGEETAKRVESPVRSANPRANLAKFQLGFCEAQLGNHEEAIRLYDEYLASNPPQEEVLQVRNSYKLRYATSLMKLERAEEGVAMVQELFDNREAWQVNPQFLMQGVLELGLAWVGQAKAAAGDEAAIDRISDRGHQFLDKNEAHIHVEPIDQFRFGFVDRLRKLGFESTQAGLYSLALRYFSYLPTIEDIRNDVNLAIARQPAGVGVPAQFQALLDQLAEREKTPIHPDAEILRLVASCYELLGNIHAPRAIYWHLATQYPQMPEPTRGEILHEASRLSTLLGDHPAAQYFGEKFMSEAGGRSELKHNVSTFMLQSLFTAGSYDEVIRIAKEVHETHPVGAPERELADALYPLALYTTRKHEEAVEPFAEYVKSHPEGPNREAVMFHRASNSLILGRMRDAAEQCEDFLKAFPESERFLDAALADLVIARFNLQDYPAVVANVDRLVEVRPQSVQVGRSLNLKGDALLIQSGHMSKEQAEEAAAMRQAGLEAYLAAVEGGKAALAADPERADLHKETIAEALWKSADIYYQDGQAEKGIAQYDAYFPDLVGTSFEPQISIFSIEHLEAAGRGEEALVQAEKMILALGNQPPEAQDLEFLRQAIGSYSEASLRIRGQEKTLATLEDFPGLDDSNQMLLTWLKIQQVIVLQASRTGLANDSPEYAATEARIAEIFEDLRQFEKRDLSEFALQQIGLYFAGTDNPFLGVPYFEELLARTTPEAEAFKGPAEMELGKIEMRAADPAKLQSARARFQRIIADGSEDSQPLKAQAYLNLADLHMRNKEWRDAYAALDAINKNKDLFARDRAKRAESTYKLGVVLDELGDPAGANQAYLAVVSTYPAYYDWVTQAWERYIPNSLKDIESMKTGDPLSTALKRQRELTLYKLTVKYVYQWQALDEQRDAPSGALARLRRKVVDMKAELRVTPQEERIVLDELGIAPRN